MTAAAPPSIAPPVDALGEASPTGTVVADPALAWRVNPWRQAPLGAVLALLLQIPLWVVGLPPLTTLAMLGVWNLSLRSLLFPTQCRIDAIGVHTRTLLAWETRRWEDVRRAQVGRGAVFVSPFSSARWLDRFRGLLLPLPFRTPECESLRQAVRHRLACHGL